MWKVIFILLFEIGFGIKFNIFGIISLSELFLLFFPVFYIKVWLFKKYPVLKKITLLYIGLLSAQIISEMIVGNKLDNAMKGIAITTISYLHFIFLFRFFIQDRKYVVYILLGILIRLFIFGTDYEGDIGEAFSGENNPFLKFYLVPIFSNTLMFLSVFFKKTIVSLLYMFVGVLFIILGARSGGAILLLTGLIAYMIQKAKSINKNRLILSLLLAGIIGQGLYVIYVNEVLSGNFAASKTQQLMRIKNPYNPINLLIMGRTEVFVGWEAFMDQFWFGHGAWTADTIGKYELLMQIFKGATSHKELTKIPSHSVLIGAGVQNGIFAFLFMLFITLFFLKIGFKVISKTDPYCIVIISFLITFIWNVLFSPANHFRMFFPVFFALFLASYLINNKKK